MNSKALFGSVFKLKNSQNETHLSLKSTLDNFKNIWESKTGAITSQMLHKTSKINFSYPQP